MDGSAGGCLGAILGYAVARAFSFARRAWDGRFSHGSKRGPSALGVARIAGPALVRARRPELERLIVDSRPRGTRGAALRSLESRIDYVQRFHREEAPLPASSLLPRPRFSPSWPEPFLHRRYIAFCTCWSGFYVHKPSVWTKIFR